MPWIDKIIGWFSPKAAAERAAWRAVLDEQRAYYDAGDNRRLNSGWSVSNQSAEFTDRYSRDIVKARARDLERNSDLMNSVVGPFVRNVVGKGLVLQAETGDPELNTQIERLWRQWGKKQNCDITKTQSLNQILRMAVRRKKVDGGVLFVKCYTPGGLVPFKLQVLEVDELDSTQMAPKHTGNRVVGGIEYNRNNAPVGYWFRQYSLDGFVALEPVYKKADDVIFYFSRRRPSQLREMSDMAQTITRIRDANEFMTAVGVKQRIEACLAVFIKRVLPTGGVGRAPGAMTARESYAGKRLAPGMIHEMNAGDEIQVVNPQGQATDAVTYVKLQQRLIGAGQGVSYEATSRDMSEANYSSARQGLIEDGMTYAEEDELLADVLGDIYETFLISAVLAGLINIPPDALFQNKEVYFRHTFVKPPKDWIDPTKEASATQVALASGQKTFKQIAAENGQDWKKQVDDICEVLEYAKTAHGVDLGGVILGQTSGLYEGEEPAEPEPSPALGDGTAPGVPAPDADDSDADGDGDEPEPDQ